MRRFLYTYLALCAFLFAAWQCFAQLPMTHAGKGGPSSSGCSQATTFLARTSGLSGTESSAYTTMICGMVTDGTWCGTTIDALYIFATNTTTTANLNLCSTSFGLTANNSPTFTADQGYTGNGTNMYLDSGFVPSSAGGNYTLNSASIGACVLTSSTTTGDAEAGSADGAGSVIRNLPGSGIYSVQINSATDDEPTNSNSQGFIIASRTGASAGAIYKNGSSIGSITQTSTSLTSSSLFILAEHSGGSPAIRFTSHQLAAVFFGGGLNSTQAGNIRTRIAAYLTALSLSGC